MRQVFTSKIPFVAHFTFLSPVGTLNSRDADPQFGELG